LRLPHTDIRYPMVKIIHPQSRQQSLTEAFTQEMSGTPSIWARAPGRVELMGSHTDYNDGFVLTMAIDRDTWIAARPRQDRQVRVASINAGEMREFSIDDLPRPGSWTAYIHGVLWLMSRAGYECPGFDAVIEGNVPVGSGLSSSASLAVATAILTAEAGQHAVDRLALAKLCRQAENDIVGVPCGILDQYSSLFGQARHAMLLDCRALTCQQILVPESLQVVICDTRAPRQLSNSAYADRRTECETGLRLLAAAIPEALALRDITPEQFRRHAARLPETIRKRCRYIVDENQRVLDMANVLEANDWSGIREICTASFRGADRLYEIVTPEMTAMWTAASEAPGVVGVRNSGGGFGGCLVAFVDAAKTTAFMESASETYKGRTGIAPNVFCVSADDGAARLNL
jgi:galactokinase